MVDERKRKEMKQQLISILAQYGINLKNLEMLKGKVPYSILVYVNSNLRNRLTQDDSDIGLILSYDFIDIKDFIGRLEEALPLMRERKIV
jgi:hypothetical protein